MFVFDAHLDLAMNALEGNRDLTRPIGEIRGRETGLVDKPDRGNGTVCLPEMRRGKVGICVATQIARYVKAGSPLPGWKSPEQAWAHTQGQLAWYRAMEEAGQMVQIRDAAGLHRHAELWKGEPPPDAAVGYILSLEGADSIVTLKHLERAYRAGSSRPWGPAHYGPGTYAHGTEAAEMIPGSDLNGISDRGDAGLGRRGRELLTEMERLGIILDVTHLSDQSFREALAHFPGLRVGEPFQLPRPGSPPAAAQRRTNPGPDRTRRRHRRMPRRLDAGARVDRGPKHPAIHGG